MKKKLRLSSNRILTGFCGGLGDYFEVDPLWIRLMFAAVFFYRGTGLGIYLLGSLIVYLNTKR